MHPWQDHIGKWNVLWCWRDPFHRSKLSQQVLPKDVRSGQLINHFPGATFTTKVGEKALCVLQLTVGQVRGERHRVDFLTLCRRIW